MAVGFQWITTAREFAALESRWRQVYGANPAHRAFLSWDWVASWWRCFGEGRELRVLCAQRPDGQTTAILPLCITPRKMLGKTYLREWNFIGAESIACSDHLGCLVDANADHGVTDRLWDAVWSKLGNRDVVRLTDMEAAGGGVDAVTRWAEARGIRAERVVGSECPLTQLPESFETYLGGLSKNFRTQVRLKRRRVADNPELTLTHVVDGDEAARIVPDLIRLSKLRMAELGLESTLSDPRMERFLTDAVPRMVGRGSAWLDVLRHGAKVAAVAFHLRDQRAIAFYQGGFDPEYAWYSPMTVLLARVIERTIADGYRCFDFLRGSEPYKYRWGAQGVRSCHLILYPGSGLGIWVAQTVRRCRRIARALSTRSLQRAQ